MVQSWQDPTELARRYALSVYRLAYARIGNRADAEDVMQEVFLRLIKTAPQFTDEEHGKAWLLRVTANCANDFFRAPWRRREGPLEETLCSPDVAEETGVLEAVLKLPSKYRLVIHLHYYEDLPVAEIAEIIGKSEGAVKTRLFRARGLLRDRLEKEGARDAAQRI